MHEPDTIAAIATPPGRGGVAVIRVSGPDAFAIASRITGRSVSAKDAGRFFHASFHLGGPHSGGPRSVAASSPIDDGLVLVFASPHSYTGEDVVEFQGHGGTVAPRRVLEAAIAAGARLARRGEFTLRAFLNGRLDLSSAEAVIDLVDAKTSRAADDAVRRLSGGLKVEFERFYASAVDLSARVEHALDFNEDELPDGFLAGLSNDIDALAQAVRSHLSTAREGKLLRDGALVVLAGPPNAGKSSLLNALLGEDRAIVSSRAGTTRDSIEEWMEIDGWPVRLADTAGIRESSDAIEAEGVARARGLAARADIVLALDCDIPSAIRIHAKCDLGPGDGLPVSSKTSEGLSKLKSAIAHRLAALSARADDTDGADITTRQKELLDDSLAALSRAVADIAAPDLVLAAGELRTAAESLGRLTGKVYSDDLLDSLFSRFCIGK